MNGLDFPEIRRYAVGDVFRRLASCYPDKLALLYYFPDNRGTIQWTYREWNSTLNRLANSFMDLGVKRGDFVAVFASSCPHMLLIGHALMKLGASIVPVNPNYRGKDITYILSDSKARVMFVEDSLLQHAQDVKDELKNVQRFGFIGLKGKGVKPEGWLDMDQLMKEGSDKEPEVAIGIDDVASLSYTSGTEAWPKGVQISHGNYFSMCMGVQAKSYSDYRPEDVYLCGLPVFYTGGFCATTCFLMIAATVILLPSVDPNQILDLIPKHKATLLTFPPTVYVGLVRNPKIKETDLSSLRNHICFGTTLPKQMIVDWNKINNNIEWRSLYASSELGVLGCAGKFKKVEEVPAGNMNWIGKATQWLDIRIVDDDDNDVPVGEAGEIVCRGPSVFKGYLNMDEKNQETFKNGWFHSGDLASMDEQGNIFFVDRKKDMVKSGGENIASATIEQVIGSHPKVAECAAFGLPHAYWGEALAVSVIPKADQTLTEEELLEFCKEKLPKFKIPKFFAFSKELPRAVTGKILKKELRVQYKDVFKDAKGK